MKCLLINYILNASDLVTPLADLSCYAKRLDAYTMPALEAFAKELASRSMVNKALAGAFGLSL